MTTYREFNLCEVWYAASRRSCATIKGVVEFIEDFYVSEVNFREESLIIEQLKKIFLN